jgi:quercetin dioxygenase-like cupin family protein
MNNGVMVAGEGRSIWVVGDRYTIKCSGKDTSGAYALLEAVIPPGAGPPPHIHSREDEAFYVLDGDSSSMPRVAVSPQLLEPG